MSAEALPVSQADRIQALDVLRGVAIFGILIANMLVPSGYYFLEPAARAALPTASGDGVVLYLIHLLVEGKFYSIFSLLFGVGFAVQWRRAEAKGMAFPPLFRRRLLGLLLIGLVHALLIWAGDILVLYALLGFLLLPFHHVSDRTLLRAAVICLALPVGIYLLMLAAGVGDPFATATAGPTAGVDYLAVMLAGFSEGSWSEALRSNAILLIGRWVDLFVSLRFPKVFGMFLLGYYLGRRGIGMDPVRDASLLKRTIVIGLTIGLPANAVMVWLADQGVYLPASPLGLMQTVAAAIGLPALALGYSACVVLAFGSPTGKRILGPVGPAGRMALTNYLMHSLLMTTIFYGWGLGWYSKVGPLYTTLLAVLICLIQVPLSRLWLERFRFGPVEWLWRQFTYRRVLPLRRAAVVAE